MRFCISSIAFARFCCMNCNLGCSNTFGRLGYMVFDLLSYIQCVIVKIQFEEKYAILCFLNIL